MFTYQYAQPDFYHFSLDSIHLAEYVATRIKNKHDLASLHVLDLCAGCGVIGFELSWHIPQLKKFDFLEIQACYTSYFQQNVSLVNRNDLKINWLVCNYDVLQHPDWHNKYDLIISNPPYFHPRHGLLSPSVEKNRCRFFLDSTFECYISAVVNALAVNGEAYLLLRSLSMYGEDAFKNLTDCLPDSGVIATKLIAIRGTDVILLQKVPEIA